MSQDSRQPIPAPDVLAYLCWRDRRHPEFLDRDYEPPARTDCSCDNCFYGRDRLALEIIRLRPDDFRDFR